jgi:hypothetical protein
MQGEATSRIQKIRSAVQAERSLLHSLEQSIIDENTRKYLIRTSTHLLDDVENFFLNLTVLQEPRSPSALATGLAKLRRCLDGQLSLENLPSVLSKNLGQPFV